MATQMNKKRKFVADGVLFTELNELLIKAMQRAADKNEYEMVECLKQVAKLDGELSVDERNLLSVGKLDVELSVDKRNLLSVGYKNVIGARRASWRSMSSIEQKEESKGNESNVKLIKRYRQKVEDELDKICQDILDKA